MGACPTCDDSPSLNCSRCRRETRLPSNRTKAALAHDKRDCVDIMDKLAHPPLLDDTCDACERKGSFGFRDEALARRTTSQVARGLSHPYYLVRAQPLPTHVHLWFYVKAVLIDTKVSTSFIQAIIRDKAIRDTIHYMGGTIVAAYNSLGDEVEP